MHTAIPKRAYSIPEVCQASSLGKSSIYAHIAAGRLKAKRVGRRTIVPAEALDEFIDSAPDARAA